MALESSQVDTVNASLVERMKQVSKKSHNVSNGLVMARLAVACTDEALYARALTAFWLLHSGITDALEKHKNHPALKSIAELSARAGRKAAFEADLRFFRGENWRARVGAPTAPVKAYLDRLSDISEEDPVLLVAHAYTQQMALLAGGQRISKFISSTLPSVNGDEGVSVFAFQESVPQLKSDYCQAVNALGSQLGEDTVNKILQEHVRVFELNNRVIGSFPVRARHSMQAVLRLLPPELLLCICAATFAVGMMCLLPRFNAFAAWLDRKIASPDVEGHSVIPGRADL